MVLTDESMFDGAKTCAIVGNSPVLLESNQGQEIDSHDVVLRLNSAPVEGYERYVGERETARLINCLLQRGESLKYTDDPDEWIGGLEEKNLILKPCRAASKNAVELAGEKNNVIRFTDDFRSTYRTFAAHSKGYPSTGLVAVWMMKHLVPEITLYGFDGYSHESGRIHYWEDAREEEVNHAHKWEWERLELKRILKRDYISESTRERK